MYDFDTFCKTILRIDTIRSSFYDLGTRVFFFVFFLYIVINPEISRKLSYDVWPFSKDLGFAGYDEIHTSTTARGRLYVPSFVASAP